MSETLDKGSAPSVETLAPTAGVLPQVVASIAQTERQALFTLLVTGLRWIMGLTLLVGLKDLTELTHCFGLDKVLSNAVSYTTPANRALLLVREIQTCGRGYFGKSLRTQEKEGDL